MYVYWIFKAYSYLISVLVLSHRLCNRVLRSENKIVVSTYKVFGYFYNTLLKLKKFILCCLLVPLIGVVCLSIKFEQSAVSSTKHYLIKTKSVNQVINHEDTKSLEQVCLDDTNKAMRTASHCTLFNSNRVYKEAPPYNLLGGGYRD